MILNFEEKIFPERRLIHTKDSTYERPSDIEKGNFKFVYYNHNKYTGMITIILPYNDYHFINYLCSINPFQRPVPYRIEKVKNEWDTGYYTDMLIREIKELFPSFENSICAVNLSAGLINIPKAILEYVPDIEKDLRQKTIRNNMQMYKLVCNVSITKESTPQLLENIQYALHVISEHELTPHIGKNNISIYSHINVDPNIKGKTGTCAIIIEYLSSHPYDKIIVIPNDVYAASCEYEEQHGNALRELIEFFSDTYGIKCTIHIEDDKYIFVHYKSKESVLHKVSFTDINNTYCDYLLKGEEVGDE